MLNPTSGACRVTTSPHKPMNRADCQCKAPKMVERENCGSLICQTLPQNPPLGTFPLQHPRAADRTPSQDVQTRRLQQLLQECEHVRRGEKPMDSPHRGGVCRAPLVPVPARGYCHFYVHSVSAKHPSLWSRWALGNDGVLGDGQASNH